MGTSTPTWAELSKAQSRVKDVLDAVVNGGETVSIHEDGEPVAVILPYGKYARIEGAAQLLETVL